MRSSPNPVDAITYVDHMARGIRFGYQLTSDDKAAPVEAALRAQRVGFDVVLSSDHVGPGGSPIPMLSAMAAATDTIRLGTFVLNSDMRNPVQLAWEASTLDHLSHGRFELGLGAGHTPQEYAQTGIDLQPPAVRKAALCERVEIIRRLLDGETVDFDGQHHRIAAASIDRSSQDHLPILVGGNGRALLEHAGAHADIIGLQGLGRTLSDGHRHEVDWSSSRLDAQVEQIRTGAGHRFGDLELNALVQIVDITEQREFSLRSISDNVGSDVDVLDACPYVLVGTVDEIVAKVLRCRERWGITYFAVRALEPFGDVIDAVRSVE